MVNRIDFLALYIECKYLNRHSSTTLFPIFVNSLANFAAGRRAENLIKLKVPKSCHREIGNGRHPINLWTIDPTHSCGSRLADFK